MPHRKPVQVTTTTHAFVLAFYGLLTVLGVLHVTNLASHTGMLAMVGQVGTGLWALAIVVAGITASIGAVGSRLLRNPTMTLFIEAVGIVGLVATSSLYIASLWTSISPNGVLATQVPQWAVVVGGIARVAQILVETRRISHALSEPAPSQPPPLAEADV